MGLKRQCAIYSFLFRSSWQETFEYRVSSWIQLGISSFFLISIFFLWNDVFGESAELLGYSKKEIVTYYVIITYLFYSIYAYVPVSVEIRNGELSKYLIRPVQYFTYHYWRSLSKRILRLLLGLPVFFVFALVFSNYFQIVTSPVAYLVLLVTLFGAINILFLLDVMIGLIEFWFLYSDAITFITELLVFFLAGTLIPLAFLPNWIQFIARVTPFQYTGAFIVDAFVGNLTWAQIMSGIAIQTIWTIVLLLVVNILWVRGIKRYEAFGG